MPIFTSPDIEKENKVCNNPNIILTDILNQTSI
jgi:hypothetical protein